MTDYPRQAEVVSGGTLRAARTEGARAVLAYLEGAMTNASALEQATSLTADDIRRLRELRDRLTRAD